MQLKLENIQKLNIEDLQDDVLNFKDSDRDSVVSYFEKNGMLQPNKGLDTPTRILNNSNEFLPLSYPDVKVALVNSPLSEKDSKSKSLVTQSMEFRKQKEKMQELLVKIPIEQIQENLQNQFRRKQITR